MCWSSKKTQAGLRIDRNKVPGLPPSAVHDQAVSVLVDTCAEQGLNEDNVRKALRGVTIQWWDYIAPRPSTGELNTVVVHDGQVYSGLTIGSKCLVAWRGRIYRSAFCHELLHIIGREVLGNADPEHSLSLLWEEIMGAVRKRLQEMDI